MLPMPNRLQRGLENAFLLLLALILFSGASPVPPTGLYGRLHPFTGPVEFDYVRWTLDALFVKLGQNAPDWEAAAFKLKKG